MIHGTLYERLLGRAVSHGCIRVGRDDLRQGLGECADWHAHLHLLTRHDEPSPAFGRVSRRSPWGPQASRPRRCSKHEAAPAPSTLRAQAARLQRGNSFLQRQIELADGKEFYLVLDPGGPDLTLMLSGAELQRYPVVGLQVGEPRVSWVTRRAPDGGRRSSGCAVSSTRRGRSTGS